MLQSKLLTLLTNAIRGTLWALCPFRAHNSLKTSPAVALTICFISFFLLLSAVGMLRTADSSKLHNLHRDNILKTSRVLQSKCYVLAELWSLQEYYSNVRQCCGSVSCQQGIRVAMKVNSPESLWSVFSLRSSFSAASSVKTRRKHSDFSIDIKTSAAAALWQEE